MRNEYPITSVARTVSTVLGLPTPAQLANGLALVRENDDLPARQLVPQGFGRTWSSLLNMYSRSFPCAKRISILPTPAMFRGGADTADAGQRMIPSLVSTSTWSQ